MNELPDEELVKRAQGGDRAAFSVLTQRYYAKIFGYAYRSCGQRQDAEDVAQEVCIKLAQQLKGFRFESKFSTWLYRLAINCLNDFYRKQKSSRGKEVIFGDDFEVESGEPSAEERVQVKEVYCAVSRLSATLRDTVLLVCGEGMEYAEAGKILGCTENTVAWRMNEAKKQLSARLGGQ